MTTPTIYNYDPATRVFLSAGVADADPLDPINVLMPAHSTQVAPPHEIPAGQVAVFDETAQTWALASTALFDTPAPAPASLEQLKVQAQLALDDHFTQLYNASALSPAIAHEYNSAYVMAKAWLDGGMTGAAPARVTALALGMGVTQEQAAQFVVAKWNEAESVIDRRGAERLLAKAAVRAATSAVEVYLADSNGRAAMSAITFATT